MNEDQMFAAAQFLDLNEDESRYLSLLNASERTVNEQRKKVLQKEVSQLRDKQLQTDSHLSSPRQNADSSQMIEFYSDPTTQLVFLCLTIPKYLQDPDQICKDYEISPETLELCIDRLVSCCLIEKKLDQLVMIKDSFHLPRESPVFIAYSSLLRVFALQKISSRSTDTTYNFSVMFSANDDTRKEIQADFLKFLANTEERVSASPKTEVFQMVFDLFSHKQADTAQATSGSFSSSK